MNVYEIAGTAAIGLICLAVGLVCLVRAEVVRYCAIRTSPKWTRRFIQTDEYLWSVRLAGVAALLISTGAFASLIWGKE